MSKNFPQDNPQDISDGPLSIAITLFTQQSTFAGTAADLSTDSSCCALPLPILAPNVWIYAHNGG